MLSDSAGGSRGKVQGFIRAIRAREPSNYQALKSLGRKYGNINWFGKGLDSFQFVGTIQENMVRSHGVGVAWTLQTLFKKQTKQSKLLPKSAGE